MDYFEQVLKEIDSHISIETDIMIESSKKLEESTKKIEELKRQKAAVLAVSNKLVIEY
jgi:hypothetical protein